MGGPDPPAPVPETTFVEGSGNAFNTIPPSDFGFFELLNELVQENPAGSTDVELMGQLAAIGIVKGKPFEPDERMRRILEDAAAVGSATSRALVFDARTSEGFEYYEGSAWLSNLWIGGYTFETPPPLVTHDGIEPLPATGVKAVTCTNRLLLRLHRDHARHVHAAHRPRVAVHHALQGRRRKPPRRRE